MSDQNEPVVEEREETPTEAAAADDNVVDAQTEEERVPGDNEPEGGEVASTDVPLEIPVAPVVAQEAKVVGDEELGEPRQPEAFVVQREDAAQVAQPREDDPATVQVHEVTIALDTVITDPSDPLAVQVPDAGRGSLDLPIHGLSRGVPDFSETYKSDDDES